MTLSDIYQTIKYLSTFHQLTNRQISCGKQES